jgi:hypothetical protein
MNFMKWLIIWMALIACTSFMGVLALSKEAVGVASIVALTLSFFYGIITLVCELAWKKYNGH